MAVAARLRDQANTVTALGHRNRHPPPRSFTKCIGEESRFGGFAVNKDRVKEGVAGLTRDIMTIQAEGNYQKAKELGDRLGVVRPPVQKLLDKLNDVPVDIEPRFTTADTLR